MIYSCHVKCLVYCIVAAQKVSQKIILPPEHDYVPNLFLLVWDQAYKFININQQFTQAFKHFYTQILIK